MRKRGGGGRCRSTAGERGSVRSLRSKEREKEKRIPHILPYEAQVHSQPSVDAAALQAEEDPVRDRGPRGHAGRAVDADLSLKNKGKRVFVFVFVNFECLFLSSSCFHLSVAREGRKRTSLDPFPGRQCRDTKFLRASVWESRGENQRRRGYPAKGFLVAGQLGC